MSYVALVIGALAGGCLGSWATLVMVTLVMWPVHRLLAPPRPDPYDDDEVDPVTVRLFEVACGVACGLGVGLGVWFAGLLAGFGLGPAVVAGLAAALSALWIAWGPGMPISPAPVFLVGSIAGAAAGCVALKLV